MTSAPIDTVTLELINGALRAARAEMEALIDRTSMSPFIREKKDYFTAFLDREGKLVVSTSLTLAGNLVDAILEEYPADTMCGYAGLSCRSLVRLRRGLGASLGHRRHGAGLD